MSTWVIPDNGLTQPPAHRRVLRRMSLPPTRRQVRALLGLLWLLDAALQAQPQLFSATTWRVDIAQSVMGEPSWVRHGIFFTIGIISAHPVAWNSAFVAIQGLIGLALLLDRFPRLALLASLPYVLGVWWVGEGFGALPTGFALLAAGAPGPVLLYSLIGFLAWPRSERATRAGVAPAMVRSSAGDKQRALSTARSPSELTRSARDSTRFVPDHQTVAPRSAAVAWVFLWSGQALLHVPWVYPPSQVLTANIEENSIGSPLWLVDIARHAEALVAGAPLLTTVVLVVVDLAVGLGILLPSTRRPALLLALITLVVFWVVGQDFGGILAPGGTDPSSAPLLALLAIALWPPDHQRFVTFPSSRSATASKSQSMDTSTPATLANIPPRCTPRGAVAHTTAACDTVAPATATIGAMAHDAAIDRRAPRPAWLSRIGDRLRSGRRPIGMVVLLCAGALALAACSSTTSSSSSASSSTTAPAAASSSSNSSAPVSSIHIIIKNFAFHPDDFTVSPGATITVTNEDSVDHTFTARNKAFNTGDIAPGQTVHLTAPSKPGSYPYLCLIHQFMTGTMTVS